MCVTLYYLTWAAIHSMTYITVPWLQFCTSQHAEGDVPRIPPHLLLQQWGLLYFGRTPFRCCILIEESENDVRGSWKTDLLCLPLCFHRLHTHSRTMTLQGLSAMKPWVLPWTFMAFLHPVWHSSTSNSVLTKPQSTAFFMGHRSSTIWTSGGLVLHSHVWIWLRIISFTVVLLVPNARSFRIFWPLWCSWAKACPKRGLTGRGRRRVIPPNRVDTAPRVHLPGTWVSSPLRFSYISKQDERLLSPSEVILLSWLISCTIPILRH